MFLQRHESKTYLFRKTMRNHSLILLEIPACARSTENKFREGKQGTNSNIFTDDLPFKSPVIICGKY